MNSGDGDTAGLALRRRLSKNAIQPVQGGLHLLQRSLRVSEIYFPTEELYSLLRPLGITDASKAHDWFNLVFLPFIVFACVNFLRTGAHFGAFLAASYGYFGADLLWVIINPSCVKSPGVIAGHHVLTMLYILLPACYPELRRYMAYCLLVELNTFFLILRRIWHVPPVSVCFYATWIFIRLVIYPYLIWEFWLLYWRKAQQGEWLHPFAFCPAFQTMLTVLNLKWTVDLVNRKLQTLRNPGQHAELSKGL